MRRFAFNALAGLSLVVCLGLIPFWCGRTFILNLHRGSLEINMYRHAACWNYSSGEDYYNGTISFFVTDPRHGGLFPNALEKIPPEYLRVRARHPSGLWLGTEPGGSQNERVGWFSIFLPTGVAAIIPALWIILRVRERVKYGRRGKLVPNRRVNFAARLRRLTRIISLTAFSIFAMFWIISVRGWDVSLEWLWSMHAESGQGCITLLVTGFSPAEILELSGRWYWVPPGNRTVDSSQRGFHYERVLPSPPSFFTTDGNEGVGAASTEPIGFSLRVPDWMLCLAATIFPGWEGLALLRRRLKVRHRKEHGLCAQCGYDLRATPGHCPECGESA